MANPTEITKIIQALYDALGRMDLDGMAKLVSDSVELTDMPSGKIIRGKAGFLDYFRNWTSAFPNGRGEISHWIASGDEVVAEVIGRGAQNGRFSTPFAEIDPTGKSVEIRFCQWYRIQDSQGLKITAIRSYYDMASLLRSLGVAPTARAA